jgi:hypothetical protein
MIVTLLIRLIQKDQPFPWRVELENTFQSLKASFMIVPLLIDMPFQTFCFGDGHL